MSWFILTWLRRWRLTSWWEWYWQYRDINSSSNDGDEIAGLATEDAGGQSEIVNIDVKVPELELRLEQFQSLPNPSQSELCLTEEEWHNPGNDPWHQPTEEDPNWEYEDSKPGNPHGGEEKQI